MLTPQELASLRQTAQEALPETVAVQRPATTPDGYGSFTTSFQTVATVPGRIAPVSGGAERVIAGQLGAVASFTVTLPAGTNVTTDDELVIGSQRYAVVAVLSGGSWETVVRAIVVRKA